MRNTIDASRLDLTETIVSIRRVAKTVKGGRNMRFSVTVVVGDGEGHVGVGLGKAQEIPEAVRKATESMTLAQAALTLAEAGADMVAPSDMMDGRVGFIRSYLDENGYTDLPLMAYSAKYASAYYSPFRDAAHSAPAFGDRKTYQMDPANCREAVRECLADASEGADIIIVKPALAYLDVVKAAAAEVRQPIAVYNVSGEYSMVKAAAENGWIDEKKIVMENLISMKRAGADLIITYHALDVAEWLSESDN